jgi:hypothetical protein
MNLFFISLNILIIQKKPEVPKPITDSTESLPFSKPPTRDLNEFRMFIEKNDLEAVKKKLLNPRYLISSGDSPVIIKVSVCVRELFYSK